MQKKYSADIKKTDATQIKIGKLAQMAGVSTSTIKHYIKEGLVPLGEKTGRNMAYYDVSSVERVKLIKSLQKDKFLPLDIIKRIIDSGNGINDNLKLGDAFLKTHRRTPQFKQITEAKIEHHTGYDLAKIALLEKHGLIHPEIRKGIRYYDENDCRIIELMRLREETGQSFEYSLGTVGIYRDALCEAIRNDIRFFANTFLGKVSTEQAVKLMMEADDQVDIFLVIYRQKMLRRMTENYIRQLNTLPEKLSIFSPFPLDFNAPDVLIERNILARLFANACRGDYAAILNELEMADLSGTGLTRVSLTILALLLKGDKSAALETAEKELAEPGNRMIDNIAAALAFIFSIDGSSGFIQPVIFLRRALGYLHKTESNIESQSLLSDLGRYVRGAVYVSIPDVFGVYKKGMEALEILEKEVSCRSLILTPLPPWFKDSLYYDLLPAIEIRVNRLLAEGYLAAGDTAKAIERLRRIMTRANPTSQHAEWARTRLRDLEQVTI